MTGLTEQDVWQLLDEVKDPEIPVVSVIEMGIVREIKINGAAVQLKMTPTFSGCPAIQVMQTEIIKRLIKAGVESVEIQFTNQPPWTTEWIKPKARQKLKEFGLAPPPRHQGTFDAFFQNAAVCPFCSSHNTTLKNSFGSTLCRMIYYCNNCQQPFEQFKPL